MNCLLLFYAIFLYSKYVNANTITCFCMRPNGFVLLLKANFPDNSIPRTDTWEFSFPHSKISDGGTVGETVRQTMHRHGITGKIGKKILYTPPSERDGLTNFYWVHVDRIKPYHGPYIRLWLDLESVAATLTNHPNGDYKRLMDHILENTTKFRLIKNPIYKRAFNLMKGAVLYCTDDQGRLLFVRGENNLYGLPKDLWDNNHLKLQVRHLAMRLMRRYGIVGTLYKRLGEIRTEINEDRINVTVFHVLMLELKLRGREHERVGRGPRQERVIYSVRYDPLMRILLIPQQARIGLERTKYLPYFDELYANGGSWVRETRRLRESYEALKATRRIQNRDISEDSTEIVEVGGYDSYGSTKSFLIIC